MIVRSLIGPAVRTGGVLCGSLWPLLGCCVLCLFLKKFAEVGPKSCFAAFGLKYVLLGCNKAVTSVTIVRFYTCTDRITHLDHNSYLPIPSSLLA